MALMEALFCTRSCRGEKNQICKKVLVLSAVSTIFLVNFYGQAAYLLLFLHTSYAKVLFSIYAYFFLITAISYFITAFVDPGTIDGTKIKMTRSCSACNQIKPVRAHHCSQCNKCWRKMDHHCPWLSHCVGENNYGQFFQMLVSVTICLSLSLVNFVIMIAQPIKNRLTFQYCSAVIPTVVTVCFFIIIVQLLALHVTLITTNQTTIEYHLNKSYKQLEPGWKNPYDEGKRKNFLQVIPYPIMLFIPCRIKSRIPFDRGYYTFDYTTGKDYQVIEQIAEDDTELDDFQQQYMQTSFHNQNRNVQQYEDRICDLDDSVKGLQVESGIYNENGVETEISHAGQILVNVTAGEALAEKDDVIINDLKSEQLRQDDFKNQDDKQERSKRRRRRIEYVEISGTNVEQENDLVTSV